MKADMTAHLHGHMAAATGHWHWRGAGRACRQLPAGHAWQRLQQPTSVCRCRLCRRRRTRRPALLFAAAAAATGPQRRSWRRWRLIVWHSRGGRVVALLRAAGMPAGQLHRHMRENDRHADFKHSTPLMHSTRTTCSKMHAEGWTAVATAASGSKISGAGAAHLGATRPKAGRARPKVAAVWCRRIGVPAQLWHRAGVGAPGRQGHRLAATWHGVVGAPAGARDAGRQRAGRALAAVAGGGAPAAGAGRSTFGRAGRPSQGDGR